MRGVNLNDIWLSMHVFRLLTIIATMLAPLSYSVTAAFRCWGRRYLLITSAQVRDAHFPCVV